MRHGAPSVISLKAAVKRVRQLFEGLTLVLKTQVSEALQHQQQC